MNEKTRGYIELLKRWNVAVNLVQHETICDLLNRHVVDSNQICNMLSRDDHILDIGSGAGFPGVILAINGFKRVVLCEKNKKKAVFLREVRSKLALNFQIFDDDVRNFSSPNFISVSRAFGSLLKLCEIMLIIKSNRGVFHKGECYKMEVEEAMREYTFAMNVFPSVTNKKGVILEIVSPRRKI